MAQVAHSKSAHMFISLGQGRLTCGFVFFPLFLLQLTKLSSLGPNGPNGPNGLAEGLESRWQLCSFMRSNSPMNSVDSLIHIDSLVLVLGIWLTSQRSKWTTWDDWDRRGPGNHGNRAAKSRSVCFSICFFFAHWFYCGYSRKP